MQKVNVLNLERISAADRAKIEAVDPAVNLTDVKGWFDGEYRETWPAYDGSSGLDGITRGIPAGLQVRGRKHARPRPTIPSPS